MRLIRIVLAGLWISLIGLLVASPLRLARAASLAQPEPPAEGFHPGRLIVGYSASTEPTVLAVPGISVQRGYDGLRKLSATVVTVPLGEEESYRQQLLQTPGVAFVEYDLPVSAELIPDDALWPQQYGPQLISAPAAWDITTGSNGIVLAVLDSGIDAAHVEFIGRLLPGYDMVSRDTTPEDACGHGTHVTGIAAASGNNTAGIAGITWGAQIMPVRVLDDLCSGWVSDVVSGIMYAVDNGADVINMSLGIRSTSTLLEYATHYAYDAGVAVIAAAGNDTSTVLSYPARYPWVLAVGSVNSASVRAASSNASNAQADLLVMAPGVNILSTSPLGAFYYESRFGLARQYGTLSGTSMASPHAAGAAALLAGQAAFDTPAKIYEALYRTTIDLGPTGWDGGYGYGLIQIDEALAFDDFTPPPEPPEITVEYDWISSRDCSALAYEWIDARASGTALPVFGTDGWARVTLPFPVSFGGNNYSEMAVSANGFVTFVLPVGSTTPRDNFLIPWLGDPNEYIAPYWDDLNPSAGGLIYGLDLGDRYVVEWWQIPRQGFSDAESRLTFELVFYRDSGNFLFQYQTLAGPAGLGSSATIGLEYAEGTAGSQFSYNRAALQPGLAVLFVPAAPGSTRTVLGGCLFSTQAEFFDCSQTPTFGVNIPQNILPAAPPLPVLTIRTRQDIPTPAGKSKPLGRYADIQLTPSPPTPFTPPALVCYQYTAADVLKAGGRAANMYLAVYNSTRGDWERLPTALSSGQARLSAAVTHLSLYGVFADVPASLPVTGSPLPTWLLAPGLVALVSWVLLLLLKARK